MKPDFSLLRKVLSCPTAPLHEEAVIRLVLSCCRRWGLVPREDRFGNILVKYRRGKKKQPISFVAHMDHPGFEVVRGGLQPIVKLLGGVPDRFFVGAKVMIWDGGVGIKGRVSRVRDKKKRTFQVFAKKMVSRNGFGYFDLPNIQRKNGMIRTKAADNVISVAILLNLLKVLVQKKIPAHLLCLFTRAEEVGFVGLSGAVRKSLLSKRIPIVVLEASSVKGGPIQMGSGPVLRVGDRLSTFSNRIDHLLQFVGNQLKKRDRSFQFQRSLLAGGTCEASVLTTHGYHAGCLAFPLGNYHNQGPNNYAAEFIHQKDYRNMLRWLVALSQRSQTDGISSLKKSFQRRFQQFGKRLKRVAKGK